MESGSCFWTPFHQKGAVTAEERSKILVDTGIMLTGMTYPPSQQTWFEMKTFSFRILEAKVKKH